MVNETKKIMNDPAIAVTATTVRVPVIFGHSESVNIETEKKITPNEVRELFHGPGVRVVDDPARKDLSPGDRGGGGDETFVGRIREDESIANGINMWVVADNIRKGAALNAVQIAEILIKNIYENHRRAGQGETDPCSEDVYFRPTSDRVKESLFDILQSVEGTTFLDLLPDAGMWAWKPSAAGLMAPCLWRKISGWRRPSGKTNAEKLGFPRTGKSSPRTRTMA